MACDAEVSKRWTAGATGRSRRWRATLLILAGPTVFLLGCPTQRSREELPLSYRQAEDAFRLGDFDRAVRGYRVFIEAPNDAADLVPRAYYKMALAEYRRERYGECLADLNEMEQRFPTYEWPQAYTLRGDAELRRGNTATAMLWWERAWAAADDDERDRLAQRIQESISGLNRTTLVRARDALTTAEMVELVDNRIARLEHGGEPDRHSALGTKERPTPAPGVGPVAGTVRIGCLLPISRTYAVYGQRSLNAIRLALGAEADRLVVRDTAGQVETARRALDELIADPSIIGVIGPLRSEVAAAVAPRAEQSGLPMIALSQREGIAGRFVLQPTMTNERQAAALAEYAITQRALRQIGVIHPNDAYGNALAEAFRQQVTERKGRIVGAIAYEPEATDFGVEVLTLKKWDDEGLDAVFLPGYADRTVELAKALRQVRPELPLLGSNGWHDPPQLQRAAQELDGLVFVDGFFAGSRREATRAFVAAYRAAYQAAPEILEAQAYDAASLLLRALQSGVRTRDEVVPRLQALHAVEGVSGTISIGPEGLQRGLVILQLVDGTVHEAHGDHGDSAPVEAGEPHDSAGEETDERALTGGLR